MGQGRHLNPRLARLARIEGIAKCDDLLHPSLPQGSQGGSQWPDRVVYVRQDPNPHRGFRLAPWR